MTPPPCAPGPATAPSSSTSSRRCWWPSRPATASPSHPLDPAPTRRRQLPPPSCWTCSPEQPPRTQHPTPTHERTSHAMTDSIPLSELESSAAAKFEQLGDKHIGRIVSAKRQQQTDPITGQPKHFPSGDPMMMVLIVIQPAEGDAITLWAKGGKFVAKTGTGLSMQSAIAAAMAPHGITNLAQAVGGELAVAWTGETEAKPGLNPAKLFTADFRPAAGEADVPMDLFSE